MALILIETADPALVTPVRAHEGVEAAVAEYGSAFELVRDQLRHLTNAQLGWLKLDGIGHEQRRRVEDRPGPKGEPGSNVVLQVN